MTLDTLAASLLFEQLGYETDELQGNVKPQIKTEDIKKRKNNAVKKSDNGRKKDSYRKSSKRKRK